MTIWILLWIFGRMLKFRDAKEFGIPFGCRFVNRNLPPHNVSWACFYDDDTYKQFCWFDIASLFGRHIGPEETYTVHIDKMDIIMTHSTSKLVQGGCFQDPGGTGGGIGHITYNITSYFIDQNLSRSITLDNSQHVRPEAVQSLQSYMNNSFIRLVWDLHLNCRERDVRIRFQSEYEQIWQEKQIYISNKNCMLRLQRNDVLCRECDVTISELTPFTTYLIIIDVIVTENRKPIGYWSDPHQIEERTLDDIPVAVPTILPGFYHTVNNTNLQIYWEPIPLVKRCGIIVHYRITVVRTCSTEEVTEEIIVPPDQFSWVIPLLNREILNISVTQRTRKGFPKLPDASISIELNNKRSLPNNLFYVESLGSSHVLVYWNISELYLDDNEFVSLTVVWCNGNFVEFCTNHLHWKTIPANLTVNSSLTSVQLYNDTYKSYIYGVSFEWIKHKHVISSGIQWFKDCIYDIHGGPPDGPNVTISPLGRFTVLVKWDPYSCQKSGTVIGAYLIKYCLAGDGTCKEINLGTNKPTTSYLIKELLAGYNYSIQVGTKHKYKTSKGPWSKSIYFQTTKDISQGADDKSVAYLIVISISIVSIVLVGILIKLLYRFRNWWNKNDIPEPSELQVKIRTNEDLLSNSPGPAQERDSGYGKSETSPEKIYTSNTLEKDSSDLNVRMNEDGVKHYTAYTSDYKDFCASDSDESGVSEENSSFLKTNECLSTSAIVSRSTNEESDSMLETYCATTIQSS